MKKISLLPKFKAFRLPLIFKVGFFLGLLLSFGIFTYSFAAPNDLLLQIPIGGKTSITPCIPSGEKALSCGGIGDYIVLAYTWIIGAVGLVSMVTFTYAGLLWLLSRGNSGQVKTAQKVLTDTIAGLVLALSSYLILYTINPNLVKFRPLVIGKIEPLEEMPHDSLPGPTNITASSTSTTLKIFDHASVDGDIVTITLNGVKIFTRHTLKGPPGDTINVNLNSGTNTLSAFAHNQGTSPTNTLTIEFTNITSGPAKQRWHALPNETNTITVTGPSAPATP